MSTPSRGRIVWVELLDPQGKNPKVRPAVILTPNEEIVAGTITVAAISTQLDMAPADRQVLLPYHHQGHPRTGLREKCAAVADWLATVPLTAIRGFAGLVTGRPLLDLLAMV